MRFDDESLGGIPARPHLLPNGVWGAKVPRSMNPEIGDVLEVRPRDGTTFFAVVTVIHPELSTPREVSVSTDAAEPASPRFQARAERKAKVYRRNSEIAIRYKAGETVDQLAAAYGLRPSTISGIVKRFDNPLDLIPPITN